MGVPKVLEADVLVFMDLAGLASSTKIQRYADLNHFSDYFSNQA